MHLSGNLGSRNPLQPKSRHRAVGTAIRSRMLCSSLFQDVLQMGIAPQQADAPQRHLASVVQQGSSDGCAKGESGTGTVWTYTWYGYHTGSKGRYL